MDLDKKEKLNWIQLLIFLGMFVVILIFWRTIFVYPIKIFVVFLHEISHGIAAVLTGGRMTKIELSVMQGGACWSSGGWRIIILPAGYIGSLIIGGLILVGASRGNHDRKIQSILGIILLLIFLFFFINFIKNFGFILGIIFSLIIISGILTGLFLQKDSDKRMSITIGLITVAVTIFFIRPFSNIFGFLFGILMGAGLFSLGLFAPNRVNDIFLKFLGITSMLYAVLDIKDDLIKRTVTGSDAHAMSQIIPLPPIVWGIIWIIISITGAIFFTIMAIRGNAAESQAGKS